MFDRGAVKTNELCFFGITHLQAALIVINTLGVLGGVLQTKLL